MGKSSPSAPAAPDPAATAAAQAAANRETALTQAGINRANQVTPTGSQTWSVDPVQWDEKAYLAANPDVADAVARGAVTNGLAHYRNNGLAEGRTGAPAGFDPWAGGRWTQTTTLSPNQQRLLDLTEGAQITYGEAANNQLEQVKNVLSSPVNFTGLPQISEAATNRQAAADAMYGRINPQQEMQRQALDARLRNQGLTPGSEAWSNAWREYGMQENDLRLGIEAQADASMARTYQTEAANRQRSLEELLAQRQIPINEASSLLTGQMVQYPQFGQTPQVNVAPTDYMSAVGMNQSAKNTAYQGQVAAQQGNNAAAAGAATAAITAAAVIA